MFNFIVTHKLQEFVTPLAVYLSCEKVQNPAQNILKIPIACSDQGAGNSSEALGLVHSPLEGLKQSMIRPWRKFALCECFIRFE